MSWPRRGAVWAMAASAAIACTSYGTATNAPVDAGDAAATDGAPAASDAGEAIDAGNAADGGDACAPPSATCTGGALHSLDFSSSTLPPVGFFPDTMNATLTHVGGGRCGAGAMHVEATVPGPAAYANGMIARTEHGTFSTVRIVFAFRGPKPMTDGYAIVGCTVALIAAEPSTARTSIFVDLASTELSLRAAVRDADGGTVAGFPRTSLDSVVTEAEANSWRTFDATLTIGPSSVLVAATFDGAPPLVQSAPLAAPVARVNLDCGIPYADQPGTYSLDLDDVVFEVCP